MSDLIRREDAIKALCDAVDNKGDYEGEWLYTDEFCKAIDSVPSADRPQGEWIYGEHNVAMCDGYRCNRCDFFVPWDYEHKFIDFINDYHYCPSCGARMIGEEVIAVYGNAGDGEELFEVQKLVRCGECKHWQPHEQYGYDEDNDEYHDYCGLLVPEDDYYAIERRANDFCSYGERKNDEGHN